MSDPADPIPLRDPSSLPGLAVVEDYIDPATEIVLVEELDRLAWDRSHRGRRSQNFGGTYEYSSADLAKDQPFRPFPRFLRPLMERLVEEGVFERLPEQAIVNEYRPGEALVPHVDVIETFGPVVVTLSLLTPIRMLFVKETDRADRFEVVLRPRSLAILKGPARYDWRHGIRGRKHDWIDGVKVPRTRRVSISLRNIQRERFPVPNDLFGA